MNRLISFFSCKAFNIEYPVSINGFTFSADIRILREHANIPHILKKFGLVYFQSSIAGFVYKERAVEDELPTHENLQNQLFVDETFLNELFTFLWLIKDHGGNVTKGFSITEKEVFVNGIPLFTSMETGLSCSMANGGNDDNLFITPEELDGAYKLYKAVEDIHGMREIEAQFMHTEQGLSYSIASANNFKHSKWSRIDIVLQFLSLYRQCGFTLLKISLGVPILDCLFACGDSTEITHKISERVAMYLGGTPKEQLKTFRDVKFFYGVRSRILHGDNIAKKEKDEFDYSAKSIEFDSLLRRILYKAFTDDLEMFYSSSNEEMTQYYTKLLFNTNSQPPSLPQIGLKS